MNYKNQYEKERQEIFDKYNIEQKMLNAKYNNKKIKYWWYKRQYDKIKRKLYNKKGGI